MYSVHDTEALPPAGFPIRKSPDQSLFSGSPKLIAAYHVLHRLPLPRHPPYALCSLTIKIPIFDSIYPGHTAQRSTPSVQRKKKLYVARRTSHAARFALLQIFYAIVKEQNQVRGPRVKVRGVILVPCSFFLVPKLLVEVNGFEPMASCVQGRRSPS